MKKVLIITYYWPPGGGAGVQRWLKFASYLPESGWEPVILTVDPGSAVYPVIDESLENEVPESLKIYKTPATDYYRLFYRDKARVPSAGFANKKDDSVAGRLSRFIRGNLFIPDPRIGWNKFAFKKACEIVKEEKINIVITTSPPHSTQLTGLKLKKRLPELTWIADLRDPWTDIYYYKLFYPTPVAKRIDQCLEKRVLRTADRIIAVSPTLKTLFARKAPSAMIDVITNGYDTSDFINIKPETPEKLTMTYTGTMSEAYPVDGLLEVLQKMRTSGTDFLVRFVGTVNEKLKKKIILKAGERNTEFVSHVSHSEAIKFMSGSTVLLLVIPHYRHNRLIITGKLFEYLASGKPVLCIGPPDGDAAEIIRSCRAGMTAGYDETRTMEQFFNNLPALQAQIDREAVGQYSRMNLAKRFASVLDSYS
ncbi:MAG: glycosyltransferase family 4 protein [Bacteroidales bacterium]|nr:glycosyltransferase family 4 protein [Bacteroidales bacterium]